MPIGNTTNSYGSLAKLLHWSVVLLIIVQYLLAEKAEELPDGIEKLQTYTTHKSIGILVLLLALARIGWKLMNKGQPAPVGTKAQRAVAGATHGLLYLLILALPLSGWAMSSAANYPVGFFGLFQLPALVGENHELHETLEGVHEFLFNAVFLVATLHVLAALYHHFIVKDGVLRRMLPFVRP